MRFRPDCYICPVCKWDFASRRKKWCPGCGTLLLIASDALSDEELTVLESSWVWETLKGRWNHIANWEAAKREVPIRNVKLLLVEEWLSGLDLAPKSKGHIRSIMHILFNWAMKWELIDLDKMNPIKLVHVEGSSKRLRQPRTLSVKEFRLLLERLEANPHNVHCCDLSWTPRKRTRWRTVGRF